jgi:phosphoribosylamine--glycine ligase
MKVLVVGNGGREAALAWKIAQSADVNEVWITPHHPAACELDTKIRTASFSLYELILREQFQLAVVGPEIPLSEGVADELRAAGIATVGPSAAAARLETSKVFSKDIMQVAGLPTARAAAFTDSREAEAFVELSDWEGVVVKADGPAQGKGVVVAANKAEAVAAIRGFFDGSWLGTKIPCVLLEEKLVGTELSVFALCHGLQYVNFGSARDHKRLKDNDLGPNTGGMGTVAPVAGMTLNEQSTIDDIFEDVLLEMYKRGTPFTGFLFAGLMRTSSGLKVLEFNVRMGDPEAQVLMPLLADDIVPWLNGCATGDFPAGAPSFNNETAVHVVMAAPGYPGTEGQKIRLGDKLHWQAFPNEKVTVFPAGLGEAGGEWVSRGGRIIGVTGRGQSIPEARQRAIDIIKKMAFYGAQWRSDIGGEQ